MEAESRENGHQDAKHFEPCITHATEIAEEMHDAVSSSDYVVDVLV